MFPRPQSGISAHLCPGCGGVWIDPSLEPLLDAASVAQALRRLATDAARRAPFGGSLGTNAVGCPVCGILMDRHPYPGHEVVVDSCPAHGTWFDGGELQRIIPPVESPPAAGPFRSAGIPTPERPRRRGRPRRRRRDT